MKPANFLHMFALILLIGFTFNEQANLKANYEKRMYHFKVQKSRTSHYAGKTEAGKAQLTQVQELMDKTTEEYKFMNSLTGYKALFIVFWFMIALWQFVRYFKIDFSDNTDILVSTNYQRKTWLLSFFLFFILAAWSLYIRGSFPFAVAFYLVAVASLVRSLMLATELGLITKKRGTPAFAAVTTVTSVILYFNFLLLAGFYFMYTIGRSVMSWHELNELLELIR
jgi:hypothetical protein